MKKIIVIGSSNVDTTLHVKNFPQPGETVNAERVTSAGGGKGANQAIAAARSGAQTLFISRTGDDSAGLFMRRQLKKYGVDLTEVRQSKKTNTGHAYITLDKQGQNDIIIEHGANYLLGEQDVLAAKKQFAQAECLIAQFEVPLAADLAAFKLAKENGLLTILNPAPALAHIPASLLALTDIITPNETESAVITGRKINNQDDLAANAQALHRLGVKNVIITYGARGAYLSCGQLSKMIPAFKVQAVDTTGAGDTFIGFLAGSLHQNLDNIEQAAIFASQAAALTVQHLGAQPSIPAASEVRKAMEAQK